jgi:hypothetical protein
MENKGTNFLLSHYFYTTVYYVMKGQNGWNEILTNIYVKMSKKYRNKLK